MPNPGVNMEQIWGITRQHITSNRTNPSPKAFVGILSDAGLTPADNSWLINKCRAWPGAQTPHAKKVVEHTIQEIQTGQPGPPEPP